MLDRVSHGQCPMTKVRSGTVPNRSRKRQATLRCAMHEGHFHGARSPLHAARASPMGRKRGAGWTRREVLAAACAELMNPWRLPESARATVETPGPMTITGPTAPAGEPLRDADLMVGTTREPDSLHPWEVRTLAAFDVLDGVMDGLLRFTAEGRLAPALAEQFAISDDGTAYTFRLRQNVSYHNGEPFSGDDFVAAWELSQTREFDALSSLGWQKVERAEILDDITLVVTTTEPYAPFLSSVATTYLCPRAALAEGVESFREIFASAPIGTGPFRVTGRQPGAGIELGRWDRYWGEPAILEGIRYRFLADGDELLAALDAGEVHVAGGAGAIAV